MLNYQKVNPIKPHETTIFLWFSYDQRVFSTVFEQCNNWASHNSDPLNSSKRCLGNDPLLRKPQPSYR